MKHLQISMMGFLTQRGCCFLKSFPAYLNFYPKVYVFFPLVIYLSCRSQYGSIVSVYICHIMCCHPVVSSSLKPHSHLNGWPHSSSAPDKDKTSAAPLIQPPAPHSTVTNKERWHPYTLWLFMETLKPLFEDVPHLFCWCCCGGGSWKSLCLCPGVFT